VFFFVLAIQNEQRNRRPDFIHNRPGPVRCENAWYRSVTVRSSVPARKKAIVVSRELNPTGSSAHRLSFWL